MGYKWKVINQFYGLGEFRTHSSYKTKTKRDAETVAKEYMSLQKGNWDQHKSEIYQVSTGRLRAVFYKDNVTGLLVWRSEAMDKTGHDRDLDRFTSESFIKVIDHFHKVFDQDAIPLLPRVLRSDLPKRSYTPDPDLVESLYTDLPADLANLYMAGTYCQDLILCDAISAIFDLAETEYKESIK